MTNGEHDSHSPAGRPDGAALPPFAADRLLDPAVIAGLANELFHGGALPMPDEGRLPGVSNAIPAGIPFGGSLPAVPCAGAMQPPVAPPRVDWADPLALFGVGDDLFRQAPPEPALPTATPTTDTFYFLPQPAPANAAVPAAPALTARSFQVDAIRADFPILRQKVHGKPLIWLDNAATTQKPQSVIDALKRFYEHDNSNIHRAAHTLAARATGLYEEARDKVRRFLGASQTEEVVFVHGATEAINLVAQTFGRKNLGKGDEIVLSQIEHHANIVPWQILAREVGAVLRVVPVNDRGEVLLEEYERLLGPRTRLVALTHVSNALGTVLPVGTMIQLAHRYGARVLIDGAQSAPHMAIDVQQLDCDFYVLAGHKLFAPTGIGVLYGKRELLEAMPPWQGGGDMIHRVSFAGTTYAEVPARFEAGTPNIGGVVGLGAALDYLQAIGLDWAAEHEDALLRRMTERVRQIPGVRMVGNAFHKAAVLSFVVDNPPLSALDVGTRLDLDGIAVRTGHHCCQPLMERFGIAGTVRASLAVYNTAAEMDAFADALERIVHDATRRARSLPVAAEPERCPAELALCGGAADTCPPHLEVQYAPAFGPSPQAVADEVADTFEFLESWQDRYQYLMELGDKLPRMPDQMKTECTRVHGCQSTVYLAGRVRPGTADVLEFLADSDAELVRGLIGLLEHLFSGQRAADVLAFDVEGYFRRLGLDQHLSLNRRNGLAAMVGRVRQHAAALTAAPAAARG
ncbi:MAG: SufS family cysteine desulfurase [Gemmataceae bacterium]